MDEGTMGIVVLTLTSAVVAVLCHLAMRRFFIASVTAAFTATILFQFFAYLHVGYLDPFFLIAIVVGGALSFAIALVVGLPFWLWRRPTRPN